MIKDAYTAREIAELQLEGWPTTERAYKLMATRESWASRPRAAVGGGKEYLRLKLPLDLQLAILKRWLCSFSSMDTAIRHIRTMQAEQEDRLKQLSKNEQLALQQLLRPHRLAFVVLAVVQLLQAIITIWGQA